MKEIITEIDWRNRQRQNIINGMDAASGKVSGLGGTAELLGLHPAILASSLKTFAINWGQTP